MLRPPHRCPRCSQPLEITRDMWGDFYVCSGCGFTAEDDDELKVGSRLPPIGPFLTQASSPVGAVTIRSRPAA